MEHELRKVGTRVVLIFVSECQIGAGLAWPVAMSLLAVAAPGPEDHGVEIGARTVGGDAVGGRHVGFWRRRGWRRLLGNLHRRSLDRGRLAVSGLRRTACRRGLGLVRPAGRRCACGLTLARRRILLSCLILLALLNRGDRLGRHGLNRLGRRNVRRSGGVGLFGPEDHGVDVGGRPVAGHAVHGLVRLLALSGRLRRCRIVRRRAAGNGNCGCSQGSGGPDPRQCAVQAGPPDRTSSNKARIWRRQGKGARRRRNQNGEGPGALTPNPSFIKHQPACKPGSVGPCPHCRGQDVTAIPLGPRLRVASSNQPG